MKENEARLLLEALSVTISGLVHRLRTPLGTAMSVVSDLTDGLVLDPEDLQDGKEALRRIKDELEAVAVLCRRPSRLLEQVSLADLLAETAAEVETGVDIDASAMQERALDRDLVQSALRGLLAFLSRGAGEESPVRVTARSARGREEIVFESALPRSLAGKAVMGWADIARADQSLLGVMPLFAEAVFALHRGDASAIAEAGRLTLILRLPLPS